MSSDSEHTPKPLKRRRVVISDSESSDGSVITTRRRRRVYHVASEDDSSDDDSDVPKPRSRRKNDRIISGDDTSYESSDIETDASNHLALFNGSGELYSVRYTIDVTESGDGLVISDSDSSAWQSDWQSGDENSESNGNKSCRSKPKMPNKSKSKVDDNIKAEVIASNSDSDSSDGQSEKCPICLLSFKQQQLATPESCDHSFCLDCLLEWSKNINTCPVDRQEFTQILVRDKLDGKVLRQLPVSVKLAVEEQIQEDPTFCEVCQQCDREDRMLLCDGCDLGYHLECLTPPMNEVPMDEWFCPDCSTNSQNDAEMVEIDLEEVPDLMEEARRLGVSYGRSGPGRVVRESSVGPRIIPRTRQTERVRANIRADRDRNRAVRLSRQSEARERASRFDPDQPSTSSGIDSIYEYSRSRSSQETQQILVNGGGSLRPKTTRATGTKRKSTKRKIKKRKTQSRSGTVVREVRITEINDDGEEEEIVTYVKVKPSTRRRKTKKSKNPRKRRTKKRRARTVLSLSNRIQTVKKRLALTLGMNKPIRDVPLLIPTLKTRPAMSDRAVLSNSRYHAGISRVSLFGNDHNLNYSPTGSDEEFDYSDGNGLIVNARGRNATSSTRRYSSLKSVANPMPTEEPLNAADFIGSILNSQEFWHSKKSDATLKADGTLLVNNNTNNNNNNTVNLTKQNKHSENNNDSPIKEKILTNECEDATEKEKRLDLSSVQPNDVTQAPMYNSPRGGGNRGNFRGNYCDNGGRHSYGGQGYGGRESYGGGGRHSYSGSGPHDGFPGRDFGPPMNFNQRFEMRGPPPFGAPPFRNRNPQNFRNERPRFPMPDRMERPVFMHPDINERPAFPHPNSFPRFRPPNQIPSLLGPLPMRHHPPVEINQPRNLHDEASVNFLSGATEPFSSLSGNETASEQPEQPDEEEFDLYSDMEAPRKLENDFCPEDYAGASTALLPPPEPPSGLLDFEENSKSSKDNDSDQELVIDDTPKEDVREEKDNEEEIKNTNDKYDPFTADSDSNDSRRGKNAAQNQDTNLVDADIPIPLEPPPFPHFQTHVKPGVRLTAYDDDDDDDSQADCPNFSIYSSQTMDVARHTEQELSQQIGPLEPPPMPPDMPDDDDIIVRDVQACDLADIPEPSDPYVESLQRERRTLSKIPPKKISNDSRGKITFKIGNKFRLSNKLSNLYDEIDENIETSIQQEKEVEDKKVKQSDKSTTKIASKDADNVNIAKDESIVEKSLQENQTAEEKLVVQENVSVDAAKDNHNTSIDNEDKSDDDEEEKLKELEKELKEKEQKLREMEKQEEIDNRKDKDKDSDVEETAVKDAKETSMIDSTKKVTHKVSTHTEDSSLSNKKEEDMNVNELPRVFGRSNREDARKPITGGWIKVPEVRESVKEAVIEICEDKATAQVVISDCDDSEEDATSENQDVDEDLDKLGSGSKIDEETEETFPLEKDASDIRPTTTTELVQSNWESDGAYTPCKDELPVKGKEGSADLPFESGLEPITPTKDKANDDLDVCRTPAGYAGLGTEAISETDEPMNFEDDVNVGARKEKEMEDGEIVDDGKTMKKIPDKASKEKEEENKKKKKKKEKEKGKEADKNKENIALQNQVAWKKISKNTRERQYREKDKKSKSKEREKDRDKTRPRKKGREVVKKKEKRKELERYNVRKIVAEKPRPRKDEYGRDIREESRSRTRTRSLSRRRSLTRERRTRSYSRVRSRSRTKSRARRSWSRNRRSYSKTRSLSRRRSMSRSRPKISRRRSLSRKRSTSRRLLMSTKKSKSVARKRRSLSPRRRSRGRSLSKSRRSRSRSREKKKTVEKMKKYKSRSRSRNRKRSRSKTPKRAPSRSREKKHTKRKHVSRSRSRDRSHSRKRERNKNWEPVVEKAIEREKHQTRDFVNRRSWSAQWTPSWSRSPTPARHEEVASRGWSPPPIRDNVTVPPKNLTVILTNKEAIKKKKKEKRKEAKRGKDLEKRKRAKRNRTPPPSKEVFASGDNILVSVCFNKENETNTSQMPELPETIPLLPPTKRRRRESIQLEPLTKRSKKEKLKEKRPKSPKPRKERKKKSRAAEIAATKKPVAVIDLDQSPFREQTPSPRDVIVLSDDDDDKQAQEIATPEQGASPRASLQHDQFVSQGPKTPPEPQIKFSINKQQNNLRASMINPLHEEEEEEEEIDERADEELEMRAQEELELRLKIGPNTPPEPPTSPPTSPDAYDPFDPTKSRSPTPAASQELTPGDERDRNQCSSPRNHDVADTPSTPNEMEQKQQEQQSQDKPSDKPKIISMVTLKRASPKRDSPPVNENQTETTQPSESPSKTQQNQQNSQSTTNSFTNMNPVLATVAAAVQRSTMFNSSTPIGGQRTLLQANRISPINQTKQRSIDRPQLPNLFANPVKVTPLRGNKSVQNKNISIMSQNGNDAALETTNDTLDMSSPYSPGSSLSDGIFDPPSPGKSPQTGFTIANKSNSGSKQAKMPDNKKDAFDVLFGLSPAVKNLPKGRGRRIPEKDKRRKSTNPKVGVRMDENQLQILDDLPSSAVEMQVKDKFLKKLNRQERVVEEVKLVLKPHYTKKHVTKEEYKDIMRKAVPKICHNKTGEINPKKIAQLVEAYVKKCRNNKKKFSGASNLGKGSKPMKNLWS